MIDIKIRPAGMFGRMQRYSMQASCESPMLRHYHAHVADHEYIFPTT